MANNGIPKELRNLVKLAEAQGWEFSKTNSGHVRFSGANCPTVFYSGTPGDRRSHSNLLAQLRRSGLEIPRAFKS